ncbi:hypothetical protein COU80_04065 [Candidatus Peregrinibacteria bacterium CG10_big_fil_rev_8_21_14_0_10_55_24]|nr:MAG: hypothetical protein COU80_04065 [Candidatus Peregrinibacteria bacterium CG10_big_fil_rev_8_21_14_0_10_55_24]
MRPFLDAPAVAKRWERWLLAFAVLAFALSTIALLRLFYTENTLSMPSTGGTYIEGSVGELQQLIPWFTVTNDVNRDIVSLVFSGLLRYNPETKDIEDDLATLTVSDDARIYTLKLRDNLYWHDSTEENPHPVTPEDVLFTFQTIQNPEFPNTLLRQNFLGVEVEKLDDRTVRFRLEEPYTFFTSNLTLGIVPRRSFEGVPVSKIDQALDFGFHPIGAGPYFFKSLIQTDLSTEVTLEKFPRSYGEDPLLSRVVFRIFPDYPTLLSDIRNLGGVRLVPRNAEGDPIVPRQFTALHYTLPQYVALFFNLDRPILRDPQLRLGLQLGSNKQALADAISESVIVDTPLLEIDVSDWRYQFDPLSAQGALYASNWHLPEKVRLQRLLEMREANAVGVLQIDPIVLLDSGAVLTVTGALMDAASGSTLNGLPILQIPTQTGSWIVALPTHGGTGSIALGQNLIRLLDPTGEKIIDSFYLWRTTVPGDYRRAAEEQRILELFVATRDGGDVAPEDRIGIADLYLEKGMLRRRLSTDPRDIRVDDNGEKLSLTLLTSNSPPQYKSAAEIIQRQWGELGVHVGIVIPETREEFQEKLLARDYDVLLFGQSLLDNLDSYPYWHSSGTQKLTGNRNDLRLDAYNLSQYSSLKSDTLLELIRQTSSEEERQKALEELREILKEDVPAVFLYSPLYTFAFRKDMHNVRLGELSLHSDRFLTLPTWYLKQGREFAPGKSWWSFFGWLPSLLF